VTITRPFTFALHALWRENSSLFSEAVQMRDHMQNPFVCALMATVLLVQAPYAVAATACEELVQSVAWGTEGVKAAVNAVVSTLNLNGTASYSEFHLFPFTLGHHEPLNKSAFSLQADGAREYFGDRKRGNDPFDPTQTDEVGLLIQVGVSTDSEIRVTFT